MNNKLLAFLTAATVVGLVGLVYWPVHMAAFVWDDQICMNTSASLRHGDSWKQFLSANFCDWKNYFRPLVVAMLAAELRIFDVAPGPMHMVSLGFHLVNTLLVGWLARTLSVEHDNPIKSNALAGAAMLLYGLHPALIEPVVWISCRFELVVTFFMLLGLLANAKIQRVAIRALAVAACFFLAAGAKESAATLPLLLLLFDWIKMDSLQSKRGFLAQLQTLWQRQWPVYTAVLGAGIVYLALRFSALGFLIDASGSAPEALPARLQTVAYTLLTYWRILVWPMTGLAPTHIIDPAQFAIFSAVSVSLDLAVLAILLAGIYGTYKRKPFCNAILAVTIPLLPVLHIVPVQFDPSLYHERYIMLGLALALSLLPRMVSAISLPAAKLHTATIAGFAVGSIWLGMAVMNIRVTVPLWSDETRLWQWEALHNPGSLYAKVNLLALYTDHHNRVHAHKLADELLAETTPCTLCMINVAVQAMDEGDLTRAKTALERAEKTMTPMEEAGLLQGFVLATGRLRELEQDVVGAADAYRDAIAMDPFDTRAHMALALFLAREGKATEARAAMGATLPLLSPDVREERRQYFERTLAAALKSAQPTPAPHQP